MKSCLFSAILCCMVFAHSTGQKVGIGTNAPKAVLDIVSTSSGILIPRMTTAQKNAIVNLPKGLMIFDSTLNQLQIAGSGGVWSNVSAAGTDFWQMQLTGSEQMIRSNTPTYRRVLVGDRPIQPAVGFSNSPHGAFTVWSKVNAITEFTNYLTMDGRSMQTRSVNTTVQGPSFESDFVINPFGGNVGVGTEPLHSRFEVSGTVGASAAMFGAGKAGISIHADNPEIGFNYFYNGGTKTMKAGYAANLGMFPNNGDVYLGTFGGSTSSADFGAISAANFQQVITVKQTGNVGVGTSTPLAKLHVISHQPFGTGIYAVGRGVDSFDFSTGASMWRSYDHQAAIKTVKQDNGAAIEIRGPVTVPPFNEDFVWDLFPQETDASKMGYTYQMANGYWAVLLSGNNSPLNQQGWPGKKYIFIQPYFVGSELAGFIMPTRTMVYYNSTSGGTWYLLDQDPIQAGKPLIRFNVMLVRENPALGPL